MPTGALQAANDQSPDFPDFLANPCLLMPVRTDLERYPKMQAVRGSCQLKPDFSEAHFILAQSYELAGEKANALEAYRTFLKVVSGEPDTSRKIADYVDRSQSRIMALK